MHKPNRLNAYLFYVPFRIDLFERRNYTLVSDNVIALKYY